ncbi:unnamed protein product [Microthlaspi erraticum]|uniref:F-box domain-containing protein n=1 Tax=Microthlaspi erraticum TaxID=1685480 RepID=A0A6D2IKH2_9BRAS|nr:unnamed protein product [Microthlaspi erraticum]
MSSLGKKETEPSMSMSMESTPNPSLPEDLLLSCFARVSRLYYPTLSLVSKRFRSLLTSPELYKARSLLGHTETCLYVCLGSYPRSRWYTLCLKPNQTLTCDTSEDEKKKKNESSGYVLARVPIPSSPRVRFPGLVAVGSDIYVFEEERPYFEIKKERSSNVWILDCRTHTWREAPSLPVKLLTLSASFLNGKIYVAGSSWSWKNTVEVFNTKTQIWDTESFTGCDFYDSRSTCIDGMFHVLQKRGEAVAHNSKKGRWYLVGGEMDYHKIYCSYCEIENVMYSITSNRVLRWYDTEVSKWRCLTGLEGLPKIPLGACVRLADYGGKLVVLWEEYHYDLRQRVGYKKIWCAEIALERRQGPEIWGKVEWFDHVLTVESCDLVKVLSVSL